MSQMKEKRTQLYENFFDFVGGLLGEGVEFMTKVEIYEAIKKEWWEKARQIHPPSTSDF